MPNSPSIPIYSRPADAALDVRPITPAIGAEIHGVRLSGDLPAATVTAIRDALLRHRVVFFRGQGHLDEAEQEAFARLLGPLVPHPTVPSLAGTEAVLNIDAEKARANRWHTDVTFVPAFPLFSVLRGVVIPPVGGDTVWANTVAAYETLPPMLRGLADQLWALHSNAHDYGATRPNATARQVQLYQTVFKSTVYETEHPVVQVHPLTGERAIVLGLFVRQLLGVSPADAGHLFAMLQDHVTRLENMVRWRWQAGDVAIWDNRATQHRAIDDYGKEPRIVRRVTIDGPVSVGMDGRHGKRRDSDAQVAEAAA
ncbi:MAG TPA: TauD/TfdA family dioxygenase [Xanthobacteraceae bacterium]|nr:TauD/TfdA family dioxygenase [Xanthobacteraceae bacterium]